jgi:hypothetical protein
VTRAPKGTRPPPADRRRNGRPMCWQCRKAAQINRDCPSRANVKTARTRETSKDWHQDGNAGVIILNPSFHNERAIQGELQEPDGRGLDAGQTMPSNHGHRGSVIIARPDIIAGHRGSLVDGTFYSWRLRTPYLSSRRHW